MPEAYPLGYVEDIDEPRTKLEAFFSITLRPMANIDEVPLHGRSDGHRR